MIVIVAVYNAKIEALITDVNELQNQIDNTGATFTFEWPSYDQKIVNETLYMNLKFLAIEEKLSILARINDDEYDRRDFLGLAFDENNDGELEHENVRLLYVENTTISAILLDNGTLAIPLLHPHVSTIHTCIFKANIGYTFTITLPLNAVPNDLTYVCFLDKGEYIHIQFHIGISW